MANEFKIKHGFISTGSGSVEGELRITGASYADNGSRIATRPWVTQYLSDNSYATADDITTAINNLVDSAPGTLDTLNELAAAIGDDPDFATSIGTSIGSKLPLAGGTMTGNITFTDNAEGIVWSRNTDGASIKFYNTADGDTDSRLEFHTNDNNNEYFRWTHGPSGGALYEVMKLMPTGAGSSRLTVSGDIYSESNKMASEAHVSANYLSKFHDMTITLTGDASGTGTFNNMGDVSFAVTVANDSHTHDGRYYTETEVDTALGTKAAKVHTHDAADIVSGTFSSERLSGVYTIDVSGTSTYSNNLYRDDNRTIAPNEDTNGTLSFGFTSFQNDNSGPYADYLHLRSYTDSSGGRDNLLMFSKSDMEIRLWQQDFNSADNYGDFRDVAFKDELQTPAIKSNGTTPSLSSGISGAEIRTLIGAGTSSFDGAYTSLTGLPSLGTAAASNTGDFATAAQGTNADTAHGWGDHASAGYSTATGVANNADVTPSWVPSTDPNYLTSLPSHTHSATDITSGTLNNDRLNWNVNDDFSGTYSLLWNASNSLYTASWLQVRGSDDTLLTRNIAATGNLNIDYNGIAIDIANTEGSGADTGIRIRGARNGQNFTHDSLTSYALFSNYDSNTSPNSYDLAKIGAGMHDEDSDTGYFQILTNNGTALTKALAIDKNQDSFFYGDIDSTGDITASNLNVSNWDTAYGWGDHASAGYLTSLPNNAATFTYITLNDSATTADFIAELTNEHGAFQDNYRAYKVGWSYAGNSDLDVGFESVELAGCLIECFGGTYKHVRLTRPTTGTGGRSIYVYNDQGSSYAPGWRQIWTSDEFSNTNLSNWNTAYGWGNHASAGYLTSETRTELSLASNILSYRDETGAVTELDLTLYLDDSNLARLTSGTLNGSTGVATFTRDDASTFNVDFSAFLADANNYADEVSFNTSTGVLTIGRNGTLGNITVDLDGRYQLAGSYLTTSGKAADSNLLDGLDLHTGRNNEANKVVRTDGNGYIQAGWINTPSGAAGTINKIYCSQDDYVRYLTPANFRTQVTDGSYDPLGAAGAVDTRITEEILPLIPTNNSELTNGAGYITGVPSTFSATQITIGSGIVLKESTDRADLLSINSSTSGWGGLQITNSSGEGIWSFMVDGSAAGIYDDQNGDWAVYCVENSYVELRHNSAGKLATKSSGVTVTGRMDATLDVGVGAELNLPNVHSASKIQLHGDDGDAHCIGTSSFNNTYGPISWTNGTLGHVFYGATNSPIAILGEGGSTAGRNTSTFYGDVIPSTDRQQLLGLDTNRWQIVFCEILDSAGQHEKNLQNPEGEKSVGEYPTGTVLVWKGGKNIPCTDYADHMRMGVAVEGIDSPLIQGAEPVLVTGPINEGDYIITSRKEGHAEAISPESMRRQGLYDCVFGKALETADGESHLVKVWINI